jgi:dTDP-4-amino-4,6-dideoxygalactose transaminase
MLTTANPEYDRRFRSWRQHSMSVPDTVRHGSREVVFESYPEVGYNYRMTDLQAALGRVQLSRLPAVVGERRAIAARYTELLDNTPGIMPPIEPAWARSNWQSYCVRLADPALQRPVMQQMLDAGISTRRAVMCSHREAAYADLPVADGTLAVSEAVQDSGVILPVYGGLTDDDVVRIAELLKRAVG